MCFEAFPKTNFRLLSCCFFKLFTDLKNDAKTVIRAVSFVIRYIPKMELFCVSWPPPDVDQLE